MNKHRNTSWVLEKALENRKTENNGRKNKMFLKKLQVYIGHEELR